VTRAQVSYRSRTGLLAGWEPTTLQAGTDPAWLFGIGSEFGSANPLKALTRSRSGAPRMSAKFGIRSVLQPASEPTQKTCLEIFSLDKPNEQVCWSLNPLVVGSNPTGPTNTPLRGARHLMRKRQVPFAMGMAFVSGASALVDGVPDSSHSCWRHGRASSRLRSHHHEHGSA
jgi:hypothetical protein